MVRASKKLKIQDKVAESGLLTAAGLHGVARQEVTCWTSLCCAVTDLVTMFAVLRARFAKKLHTRLNSDDERFFITFRREKDQKLHAPQRKFQSHGGEA